MKKRFKKIYVEITNRCNLSCSFCSRSARPLKEMSIEEFENILTKIDPYTDYLYLHVKGEPLLHTKLREILELCQKYHKKINITTNGTLLKEHTHLLLESEVVRQINISLHSENKKQNYVEEIFESVDQLSKKIAVVYRFWTMEKGSLRKESTEVMEKIIKYYELSTEIVEKLKTDVNCKIENNLYIHKAEEFLWPSLENNYQNDCGYCHAIKDHIAILADGTIVPCCLDGEGILNLGNIFTENLEEILENKKVKQMRNGFERRRVTESLCRHCNFKEKFAKSIESKTNV